MLKEFRYAKDKGGKAIFNLIDGKMKVVVGKTEAKQSSRFALRRPLLPLEERSFFFTSV